MQNRYWHQIYSSWIKGFHGICNDAKILSTIKLYTVNNIFLSLPPLILFVKIYGSMGSKKLTT